MNFTILFTLFEWGISISIKFVLDPTLRIKVKITIGITGQDLLRVLIKAKDCYLDVESN